MPRSSRLTDNARGLRKRGTLGEVLLWQRLRRRQVRGLRFRRQHPVGRYIVDFYCPACRLAVEVDGASHEQKLEADLERQERLEALGLHLLRFTESEVRRDPDGVVLRIDAWLAEHMD